MGIIKPILAGEKTVNLEPKKGLKDQGGSRPRWWDLCSSESLIIRSTRWRFDQLDETSDQLIS